MLFRLFCLALVGAGAWACQPPTYDHVIRNGMIYDGSGGAPVRGDVAINADTIVAVGNLGRAVGRTETDAQGLAVAPGFINMLSWANESLLADGRSQSDLRQGVTLEVMGEGWSPGPLNQQMKILQAKLQGPHKYNIEWNTLGEYLDILAKKGVACNVASFVGATTVRIHVLGYANRAPTTPELVQMKELVRQAMEEGALGVGSSLIYPPAFYASTEELTELCRVAASYDGLYISHLRSEGNRFLPALQELIGIAKAANIRAEVYHLKAAGSTNWPKMDSALALIESARAAGLAITANMYLYPAGATGLAASLPPALQEGGDEEFLARLRDPQQRAGILRAITTPTDAWENLYLAAGSPDRVLLVDFRADSLRHLVGQTLAQVAKRRGTSPEQTIVDLLLQNQGDVGTVYFMMSEENIRKQLAYPWVSVGSDAASLSAEGHFLASSTHPRAYGNVARLLAKYVREERVIGLAEAVRRLTSLPATNLKLSKRGWLRPGQYADVVVLDPAKVQDHATFERPHQYATGVAHVWVNGQQVLKDGKPTGALPGRVVRGPGWKPKAK
jgi:N-acyl-D-amino-acid deacylase